MSASVAWGKGSDTLTLVIGWVGDAAEEILGYGALDSEAESALDKIVGHVRSGLARLVGSNTDRDQCLHTGASQVLHRHADCLVHDDERVGDRSALQGAEACVAESPDGLLVGES